jgi:TonB family protein
MKLVFSFFISALLHVVILALPLSPSKQLGKRSIPVVLLAYEDTGRERASRPNITTAERSEKPLPLGQRHAAPQKRVREQQKTNQARKPTVNASARFRISQPLNKTVADKEHLRELAKVKSTMADVSEPTTSPDTRERKPQKQKDPGRSSRSKPRLHGKSPLDVATGKLITNNAAKTQEAEESIGALAAPDAPGPPVEEFRTNDSVSEELGEVHDFEPDDFGVERIETGENHKDGAVEAEPESRSAYQRERDDAGHFTPANYARRRSPEYPERARRKGWEGTTLLKVLVDQEGTSKLIEVNRSSGFVALDRAAVKAVKRWRFHPARDGDRPIESWVEIPIQFRLKGETIVKR